METQTDSGSKLIPDSFVREMQWSDNLYRSLFPRPEPVKLTRWQQFRVWRSSIRWTVHDRLFPDCRDDDD